jgi:hypothetical protein
MNEETHTERRTLPGPVGGSGDALSEIPRKWAQPPADQIGKLPKAGTTLDFYGHANVTLTLLSIDPHWTLEPVCDDRGIPVVEVKGNEAIMWGRLTVLGHSRMGVGVVAANAFDREKQLLSDLLKNTAMRFGIATQLWSKEEWAEPEVLATPEQLGTIRAGIGQLADPAAFKAWWTDQGFPPLKSSLLTEKQATAVLEHLDVRDSG